MHNNGRIYDQQDYQRFVAELNQTMTISNRSKKLDNILDNKNDRLIIDSIQKINKNYGTNNK
jgi:hypothetical protein